MSNLIVYSLFAVCLSSHFSMSVIFAPIIAADLPIGTGDEITKVGDLDPEIRKYVETELGRKDIAIGFLYERWFAFGLDFWTSNGRYVLFSGNRYWEISDEAWIGLISTLPGSAFHIPFRYTVPSAYLVACAIIGSVGCYNLPRYYRNWASRRTLKSLEADPWYSAAAAKIFAEQPYKYSKQIDAEVFSREVSQFVGGGVSTEQAEANVVKILTEECYRRDRALRQRLIEASEFSDSGDTENCRRILAEVAKELNAMDEADIPVLGVIAEILDTEGKDPVAWRMLWRGLTQRDTPRQSA